MKTSFVPLGPVLYELIPLKTAVLSYSWPIVLGIVEQKHKERISDVLSEEVRRKIGEVGPK